MRKIASLALVASLVACGGTSTSSKAWPAVALTTFAGTPVKLTDLRGTPVVINVWQESCVPCKAEMPAFERVHQAIGTRVRFIGLNSQDELARAKEFAASAGVSYELWVDQDGSALTALRVASIPTTIFASPAGQLLETKTGAMSESELRSTIDRLFPHA